MPPRIRSSSRTINFEMGKVGDVKRGGSTRFSAAMRQTGQDSVGILDKSSKKEKLRKLNSVGEMDLSSHPTSSKRVKLPKKFFDDCDTVNHASVPRKLRSAMKKRHHDSVSPSSPLPRNRIHRFETPLKDCKVDADEQQDLMTSESIAEQITKDEEEVMAALVAMAEMFPGNDEPDEINLNNETSEAKASTLQEKYDLNTTCEVPTTSKTEDLVQESMQMGTLKDPINTVDESKDVTDGNKSRRRCSSHVYICRFIKDLQVTEGKQIDSIKEPKQQACVDVKTETNQDNVTNGYSDKILNEASMAHITLFQDQHQACSLSVSHNHANVPVTHRLAAASEQVPVLPYFGSPLYDPSQWLRPALPKQQILMNPFIPGTDYQNWEKTGCETMPPQSGSYVEMSSSRYLQARNIPQQLQYKMQFGHRSSGYDEKRGLFLVDSSPTLKLTLQ